VLASDADRTQTVALLGTQYAAGRLSLDDLDERIGTALVARSDDTLARALRDLPPRPARRHAYAPWWRRAAAWVVDAALLVMGSASAGFAGLGIGAVLIALPVALPYATVCHVYGSTVGERLLGLELRDAGEAAGRVGAGQAFGRALMSYVFACVFVVGGFLDWLWPLWDPRRQAWHDKVAGTVVVRKAA
jgi:uncharacterized RDD family membrane protein YckC